MKLQKSKIKRRKGVKLDHFPAGNTRKIRYISSFKLCVFKVTAFVINDTFLSMFLFIRPR